MLLEKMSRDLLTPIAELLVICRTAPVRYKVYTIPKKNGGVRTIAQPGREVKRLQRWVLANFLDRFPVHQAATAYQPGRRLRDNVLPHANNRFLLKMDFTQFFPSIVEDDFVAVLREHSMHGIPEEDLWAITRLMFWRAPNGEYQLSIGAPTSPRLSNIIMFHFDEDVVQLCKKRSVAYTRYADDLTFSTDHPNVLRDVEGEIGSVIARLSYPRLAINWRKTVRASKKSTRLVTGLVITNDGNVSIGRERKREIRSLLHHFVAGNLSEQELLRLRGWVACVMQAEPTFIQRMADRYGRQTIAKLLRIPTHRSLVRKRSA